MINHKFFDELSEQLGQLLPFNPQASQEEIKKHVSALLQSAFSHMDLVTRDEFEVQRAVLMRTRERLEALEVQVKALEARLQAEQTTPSAPKSDA